VFFDYTGRQPVLYRISKHSERGIYSLGMLPTSVWVSSLGDLATLALFSRSQGLIMCSKFACVHDSFKPLYR